MNFDLPAFIQPDLDLSFLVNPFSKEEIDAVVKHLPSDKAPRPDGFNTDFLKRCWQSFAVNSISFAQLFTMVVSVSRA